MDSDLKSLLSKSDSLDAKLALVRGSDMPLNEKLEILNQSLGVKDWNKLNGRFTTAKKNNPEVASVASVATLALDPTMQEVWQEMKHTVSGKQSLTKTDEWVSWTTMMTKRTEEEIDMHIMSGRLSQRECPDPPGVWELKDNNNVKTTRSIERSKGMEQKNSAMMQPEHAEKHQEEWAQAWNAFGNIASFNDLHLFGPAMSAKGLHKGGGPGENTMLPKGGQSGGKGKGKAKVDPNATVDKKKVTALKALVNKSILQLGCLGFEAASEEGKKAIAEAIKKMEDYKVTVENADTWTNQKFQDVQKEVVALRDGFDKQFKNSS